MGGLEGQPRDFNVRRVSVGPKDAQYTLPPFSFAKCELRWWVLFCLTALNVCNQWQRFLVPYLAAVSVPGCTSVCDGVSFTTSCAPCATADCEACTSCRVANGASFYNIVDGACVSEQAYGVLAGIGFGLPFCIVGLFAGFCVDRYRQHIVGLLASVGVAWSLAVAGQAVCRSYPMLLALRAAQAAAQAFAAPCSYALLAGHFCGPSRAAANGIYSFGTYIGYGMASLAIVTSLAMGWRRAMGIAATAGIGCALLVAISVRRPAVVVTVAAVEKYAELGMRAVLMSHVFVTLVTAASVRYLGGVVMSSYMAIYFSRAFPDDNGRFAVLNAVAVCLCGSFSSYAGGAIAAAWAPRRPEALGLIPALGGALACLPLVVMLYAERFEVSVAGLFAALLLGESWLGPAVAILQDAVSARHTGVAISGYMFCISVVGSLASSVIGALDPGTADLRHVLVAALLLTYGGSALLFCCVGRLLRRGGGGRGNGGGGGDGSGERGELQGLLSSSDAAL